ncbi:precorrin-2 C(20)-methyltransferase [Fusibacter bizertensis]
MSKLIGIGVGPGDPELLTLKAIRALEKLDILLLPTGKTGGESEAYTICKSYIPSTVLLEKRHFPMTNDKNTMLSAIFEIAIEVRQWVNEGKTVGFVTLGDPMLYSTYGYLLKFLKDQITIETIPGIMSFGAIASGNNKVLCEGDTPLIVYPCVDDLKELDALLATQKSLVLMKVYKSFESVKALILAHHLEDDCLIVSDFGKASQKIFKALADVDSSELSYFTTILINKEN